MAREKRVLVVEDDDAIRALLFTVLRRRGFKVDTAANGQEALGRLSQCVYSLMLLDMTMPGMNGPELLEKMLERKIAPHPLVIVLSAESLPRNLPPDVVAGTVRKPFDVQLLVDTVAACLSTLEEAAQPQSCPTAESESIQTSRSQEKPR